MDLNSSFFEIPSFDLVELSLPFCPFITPKNEVSLISVNYANAEMSVKLLEADTRDNRLSI